MRPRRHGLKPDPERVREFMQRGRQELKRTGGLTRKVRARPSEGPLTPAQWRAAVFEASEGRCIITRARARNAEDRRFHAHHPLDKSELRARGYYGRVWDPRNGIFLKADLHMQHEHGAIWRIPWTVLPASVWDFCRELDELEGTEWATQLVLRAHPTRGERGDSQQEDEDGEGRAGHRGEGDGRPAGRSGAEGGG